MTDFKKKLKTLQCHDWSKATLTFYIVKRRLEAKMADYEILNVNVDNKLARKLRALVVSQIISRKEVREYEFTSADLDGTLLGIQSETTDIERIIGDLCSGGEICSASTISDLVGSWMYISRLDLDGVEPLYAVRKVSSSWTAKKMFHLANVIYRDNLLVDLGEENVLRIDDKLDFYTFSGDIFILDKRNFEAALNFRQGMLSNRDELVEDLKRYSLFENVDFFRDLIGENLRLLRRVSQIKKSGYYTNSEFLKKLREVNDSENWGLTYSDDGLITITTDNLELVLLLLNNDRLTSKINYEDFDVEVKHKLNS